MASPHANIGHYRITSKLGEGGMGEVWRATDTRLNREVAIKVLPAAVAGDALRLARFRREAQVLASLNHPGIAAIYGVEEGAAPCLVMELVEGETLGERIATRAMPLDDALELARQMAEAFAYAHDKGVVHRDLKPANVKITPEGTVKILDFGLAKAMSAESTASAPGEAGAAAALTTAATLSGTVPGTLLGTAAYMSPEQARGQNVDRRTDIWAFGVVLYEMLTGERPFGGATLSDTLAAVLTQPVDLKKVPASARPLLRACLEKDPRKRLAHVADAMLLIGDAAPAPPAPRGGRPWAAWAASVLVAAGLAAAAGWWLRTPPVDAISRLEAPLPQGQSFTNVGRHMVAISPDGSEVVYVANQRLYLRRLDQLDAQPISGTNVNPMEPVFSPDGRSVAYFAGGVLSKVPLAGGAPEVLCPTSTFPSGVSWQGHTIAFGQNSALASAIMAVADSGGAPRVLASVTPSQGAATQPQLLPDGRHLLFEIAPLGAGDTAGQIVVQTLGASTGADSRRVVMSGGWNPRVLSSGGALVYVQKGTLFGVSFDAGRLRLTGSPVPLVAGIPESALSEAGQFAISDNGTLVYAPGSGFGQDVMTWVDRQGHEQPITAPPHPYVYPRISPDGTQVAVDAPDVGEDIWVWNFAHQTLGRLTFGSATRYGGNGYLYPVWMPDGRNVLYGVLAAGRPPLFERAADGAGGARELLKSGMGGVPMAVSPDSKWLVVRNEVDRPYALYLVSLNGGATAPLFPGSPASRANASLSPDGRWMAYQSDESGRNAIYVSPFPAVGGGKWQVSNGGGSQPVWARNGRELYYIAGAGAQAEMMAAPVNSIGAAATSISLGTPQPLFALGGYALALVGTDYDVASDGRFLLLKPAVGTGASGAASLVVVSNWFTALRTRLK